MVNPKPELKLSVVLTVVSGREAVRQNLAALTPQIDFDEAEVIVPFDRFSADVESLKPEFPDANFVFIDDGDEKEDLSKAEEHRRFDKRRAVGLQLSRGKIVAMTEDHARPAADWVSQILKVHEQPYDVIGGAVENDIETALNRAVYYCDFGRYCRPFDSAEAEYVSDVNVAYKREALMSVQDEWRDAYQETTVHWALRSSGRKLYLDDRPIVYQMRKGLKFTEAFRERIGWGRIFAETRVREIATSRRVIYAFGTLLLPFLMLWRVFEHMRRQQRTIGTMLSTLPVAFVLLIGWSWGEFIGYVRGLPKQEITHELRSGNQVCF